MWQKIWIPVSLCKQKKEELLGDPSLGIVAVYCVAEAVIDDEPSCQLLLVKRGQQPYTGPIIDCC